MEDALILTWPKAVSSESSGIPLACCFKNQPAWCSFVVKTSCLLQMLFVGRSKVDSFCTWQLWRMLTLGLLLCCSSDTPYKMNMLNLFESPIWKRTSSSKPDFFLGIKNVSACYFSGVKKRLSCWVGLLTWWVYPLGEGYVFRRLGFIGWLVGKLITTICSEITKLLWRRLVALWKDGSMFGVWLLWPTTYHDRPLRVSFPSPKRETTKKPKHRAIWESLRLCKVKMWIEAWDPQIKVFVPSGLPPSLQWFMLQYLRVTSTEMKL